MSSESGETMLDSETMLDPHKVTGQGRGVVLSRRQWGGSSAKGLEAESDVVWGSLLKVHSGCYVENGVEQSERGDGGRQLYTLQDEEWVILEPWK